MKKELSNIKWLINYYVPMVETSKSLKYHGLHDIDIFSERSVEEVSPQQIMISHI